MKSIVGVECTVEMVVAHHRKADLEKLFEIIGERAQQPTGLSFSAG
jgi:hypothetical protein